MIGFDLDEIKDLGERLPVGGYVCKILSVEDDEKKMCLKIEYDIAEGDYKGFYEDWEWKPVFFRSYKPAARPFFKALITAVENSNRGFSYKDRLDYVEGKKHFDEQSLKGKIFGAVIAEEEYESNDGKVKTRTYIEKVHSAETIRSGKYKVPDLKGLPDESTRKAKKVNELQDYLDDAGGDLPF